MSPARHTRSSNHTTRHAAPAKELRTASVRQKESGKGSVIFQNHKTSPTLNTTSKKKGFLGSAVQAVAKAIRFSVMVVVVLSLLLLAGGWWLVGQTKVVDRTTTFLFLSSASKTASGEVRTVNDGEPQVTLTAVVVRVQPEPLNIQVVAIKPGVFLHLPGDYGQYPLDSVLPLLDLEQRTPEYIRAVASLGLGVTIDKVVDVESLPGVTTHTTQWVAELGRASAKGRNLFTKEWSILDAWRFTALGWRLKPGQVVTTQVEALQAWHQAVQKWPTAEDRSTCPLAVVNTTSVSGVATRLTEVLERSQFVVVKAGDTHPVKETTQIILAEALDSTSKKTAERQNSAQSCALATVQLEAVIPGQPEVVVDPDITAQYRSEVVLMVGSDVAQFVK